MEENPALFAQETATVKGAIHRGRHDRLREPRTARTARWGGYRPCDPKGTTPEAEVAGAVSTTR